MARTKRIAIVAAHFPPSNLTSVHRSRLWAQHLAEFGWTPIIVTTNWEHYEQQLDGDLLRLVSPELRVIRTKAFPVKPIRIVGDLGARALYWHYRALEQLIVQNEIDFIHITIPSSISALLGELLYRRYRFPFGIDYIDPWIVPNAKKPFLSKAWLSANLSRLFEPWAVRNVSLITGVARLYFEPVLERHPHLRDQCVTAAMPYGNSEADYELLRDAIRDTFLFPKDDGLFHMIYAGALLPRAFPVLERLLGALAVLRESRPQIMERLRIHFVGTGYSPTDPQSYAVRPYVQRWGLEHWVDEHPHRIDYADVLNHYVHASAILILGSTEIHYTPSKVYQAVQAKRPIFALLREESTAVDVLCGSRAGTVVTFTEEQLPEVGQLARSLENFVRDPKYSANAVRWDRFEEFSARNSARVLAASVERALELFERRTEGKIAISAPYLAESGQTTESGSAKR